MADQLGRSVGDMYAGAFIPGIVLAGLYALYVLGTSIVKPHWVPALPPEARTMREPDGSAGTPLADRPAWSSPSLSAVAYCNNCGWPRRRSTRRS